MDLAPVWDQIAQNVRAVPQSGLLLGAVASMAVGLLGSVVLRYSPFLGRLLRGLSTLGLICILLLVVLQLSRMDSRFDLAVPELGMPEQIVAGGETRVALSPDGHFWLKAEVNGHPARFMVDTGATLTAVSPDTAEAANLEPRRGGIPVRMRTANGVVAAQMTNIEEFRFGNVEAQGLDAIIAPGLGRSNVVGMNLLSRLASWRVENNTLILVPKAANPGSEAPER
ncbi:retropepsin-like aspartic protease family protein [Altericroceibacterium endophyticum]|uniref:TIGR02281 family clan AA aspartic protease n=1 Tax=Altericroceibacterium endophyticum TaxID=1808508 RepID=A0A6I4T8X5_9SPHN|nr:retropepsin-like aspartic protease [Altericroceibacterium endophyticum]MXO66849.1 TIGR02281 family clan AA aspartic protease [Altericroceibacterium endophyticum]